MEQPLEFGGGLPPLLPVTLDQIFFSVFLLATDKCNFLSGDLVIIGKKWGSQPRHTESGTLK